MSKTGIGSHTKPNRGATNTWLTPPDLIEALGPFDLDPCAAPSPRPWPTATRHIELPEDGLTTPWHMYMCPACSVVEKLIDREAGVFCFVCQARVQRIDARVWLNPPYGDEVDAWMDKLSAHGSGLALIFARTETATWGTFIWPRAHSIFFFHGRLWFRTVTGEKGKSNAGGPSALISYSPADTEAIIKSGLKGNLVTDWVGRGVWHG